MLVASKVTPLVVEIVGRTEGSKEVELRARVSGILEKQTYAEGSNIKAGTSLFNIDPEPFEIALAHARASLAQEQARQQQARRTADRLEALAKQNAVSRRDADDAISAVEAADAAILAAQANVREAQLNLSYTKVVSPISGIAGRALHSQGSLVTQGSDSSLLTTVTQTDPIWVRFAVSNSEYEALRSAMRGLKSKTLAVELLRPDGDVYPLDGHVNFAGSTVDTNLGTVQLRAEFTNPALALLPGEYLRVRLSGGEQEAIAVPQTAVLEGPQGPYVWIVNAQSQAEQRVVKTGAWLGDAWHIRDGLAVGETVIVDNLMKLRAGQSVNAQSVAADARSGEKGADGATPPAVSTHQPRGEG
jgi:membrane fusion protein (multidrug efflux system)